METTNLKTKFTTLQFIWFQKFFFHYDWFDARLTKCLEQDCFENYYHSQSFQTRQKELHDIKYLNFVYTEWNEKINDHFFSQLIGFQVDFEEPHLIF